MHPLRHEDESAGREARVAKGLVASCRTDRPRSSGLRGTACQLGACVIFTAWGLGGVNVRTSFQRFASDHLAYPIVSA